MTGGRAISGREVGRGYPQRHLTPFIALWAITLLANGIVWTLVPS